MLNTQQHHSGIGDQPHHSTRPGLRRWVLDRRIHIVVSLLTLGLLVLGYWAIVAHPPGKAREPEVLLRLLRDAIPSACVGLVAYLVVNYVLYQQQIESARQYGDELVHTFIEALGDQHTGLRKLICERSHFDWSTLIGTTEHITILARYWDEEATHHRRAFIDFFKKGGSVDLLIPDPRNEQARQIAAEQRSTELVPHEYQIAMRILRTIVELRAAASNANVELEEERHKAIDIKAQLRVRYLRHAPNYEFQLFGTSDLVLTPYPHFFMPEFLCPGMWFDLRYADEMREFILRELRAFTAKRSDEVSLDDAYKLYGTLRKQKPEFNGAGIELAIEGDHK
jgi:hypothetical protein